MIKQITIVIILITLSIKGLLALTLDEAVKKALKENYHLAGLKKELKSKDFEVESVKALRFPQFFLSATYTVMDDKKTEPFTTPFGTQDITMSEKEYFDLFTGLKYNIYTGGLVSSVITLKELEKEANQYIFTENKLELIFKVKKAYLNILRLEANKKIAEDYIRSLSSHLKNAKLMYQQGLVAYIDLLQTEVKLDQAKQQLTKIKNQLKVAKSYLSTLMGEPLVDNYTVENIRINLGKNFNLKKLLKIAEENRPFLKVMGKKIKINEQMVKKVSSNFKPKVYLVGGYKYSNMLDDIEPKGNFLIQAGLSFTLDWDKPFKEKKAKKNLIYSAIKEEKDAKLKVFLEVKKALEEYNTVKENLKVAKNEVKKAEEYHRILTLKYKEGLASNTDLLDAKAMLTEALMREKNAYYDIQEKLFAIEKAIGKGVR